MHVDIRGLLEGAQTPVRYENQLINCDNQMILGNGRMDKRSEPCQDTFSFPENVTGQKKAAGDSRSIVTASASKDGENSQVALVQDILNRSCKCGNLLFYC